MSDYQCKRCGSTLMWDDCRSCGGEGYVEHECFEDSCCCLDPDDDVCPICNGEGSFPICASSWEWCNAHPLPGREDVPRSTPERFVIETKQVKEHV